MNRSLRRALDGIARDRRSGAAQLALRAAQALKAWLQQHPKPTEQELLDVARALLRAQPSMAPLLRLANEVALAVDAREPGKTLRKATVEFDRLLQAAPQSIARHFKRALSPDMVLMATYSYSSTVLHALKYARERIGFVLCSESRPGNEGKTSAKEIAAAGMKVMFATDVALASRIDQASVFITGADAILPERFVNKVGTDVLVLCALKARTPVWLLADTTKFVPDPVAARLWTARAGKRSEVWRQAPAGVTNLNPLFEPVVLFPAIRVLTERGWMTPQQVRQHLRKIRISSRLRALAD